MSYNFVGAFAQLPIGGNPQVWNMGANGPVAGERATLVVVLTSPETSISVSDDGNNTWNLIDSQVNGSKDIAIFDCPQVVSNASSISIVTSNASNPQVYLEMWRATGLNASIAPQFNSAQYSSPGTGTDAISGGNITPAAQPGVLVGFYQTTNNTVTANPGTGFTDRGTGGASGDRNRWEDKAIASTANVAATFTGSINVSCRAWTLYYQLAPAIVLEDGFTEIFG